MQTIRISNRTFQMDEETHSVLKGAMDSAVALKIRTGKEDLSAVFAIIALGQATGRLVEVI